MRRGSGAARALLGAALLAAPARARAAATDAGPDGGAAATEAGDAPGDAGSASTPTAPPALAAPPVALAPIQPAYTAEAQRAGVAGDVVLLITIDETGAVTDVDVEAGLPAGLTESAVAAARAARFSPARDTAGRPIAVRVRWKVHFTLPEVRKPLTPAPAPAPAAASPPAPAPLPPNVERFPTGANGVLTVAVREKGTGKKLPLATIWIEDVGELLHVDADGHAERELGPGAYAVVVRAPGHEQLERLEHLRPAQRLQRTYFIEKQRLNEYETIVRAPPPRAETGVVTLEAEEIHSIPGTFGDPFRAAMLLPGVGSAISGLGYPIIRGEAPGQTGTFIDDIKIPLLYHLGFGPAVVHPLYLGSLDFHPGDFPAEFGRFTGGLIRAKTAPAPEERQTMLEADLFKLSAYHAQPLTVDGNAGAISAAARYGTFAFLARALDPTAVLQYWDYQTRADLALGPGALRLLVFGASDTVGTQAHLDGTGATVPESILRTGFHRADLRYRLFQRGPWSGDAGVEAGADHTDNSDPKNKAQLTEWVARPRVNVELQASPRLKVRAGADTLYQSWDVPLGVGVFRKIPFPHYGLTYGAFAQAEWAPTPAWLIVGGVRGDLYDYHFVDNHVGGDRAVATSVDPRLAIRRQLSPGLFIKLAGGIYHAPPRFLVPWPGLEGFGLRENGLNKSDQIAAGVEALLPADVSLDAQVYFNWLERVAEYDITELTEILTAGLSSLGRTGRSYGMELIARRRLGHRLFGWVTYTLARSERDFAGAGWRPADFDETHIVNAIASYALGRSWTVSGTFHLNSGRPSTPPVMGADQTDPLANAPNRNLERLPTFWRIDARIEKREAFDTWFLDFYVDWLNISLQREISAYNYSFDMAGVLHRQGTGAILTIPTLGIRVVF
jgi:TonB family protein